jgi:hypothetical protein
MDDCQSCKKWMARALEAEEALRAAPRPTAADFDLVAYADWFFQVRGAAIRQEQKG